MGTLISVLGDGHRIPTDLNDMSLGSSHPNGPNRIANHACHTAVMQNRSCPVCAAIWIVLLLNPAAPTRPWK